MTTATSGFYVPPRVAESYVKTKRTETGEFQYDSALQDIGIERQAAIQSLNKSYSDTINNAYSQYLNSKRTILNSDMGQGYKEAYLQNQQQALQQNIAQASMNAAEARSSILEKTQEAEAAVQAQYQQELDYMNTTAANLERYFEYVKGFNTKDGQGQSYLSDYEKTLNAEQLYDKLFAVQAQDYIGADSKQGLNFLDWMKNQVTTDSDQAWFNWLSLGGGYQQFQDAAIKGIDYDGIATSREEGQKELEQARQIGEYKYAIQNEHAPTVDMNFNDFANWDFGKSGHDKLTEQSQNIKDYAAKLGLDDTDIEAALGMDIDTALKQISLNIELGKTGRSSTDNNKYATDKFNALVNAIKLAANSKYNLDEKITKGWDVVNTQLVQK